MVLRCSRTRRWTSTLDQLGEPLLIYLSDSPENCGLCRALYLVDLRSVYPPLANLLGTDSPPIRFNRSVPLLYPGQTGFHKNWAVFTTFNGDILIHTDLIPQRIYWLPPSESFPTFYSPVSELATLAPLFQGTDENCLSLALNDRISKPNETLLHQSSPLLEVVLCTSAQVLSGSCDLRNRIYIMLIHAVHKPGRAYYEPRIVTLNPSPPFDYLSISKPLVYGMSPHEISDRQWG